MGRRFIILIYKKNLLAVLSHQSYHLKIKNYNNLSSIPILTDVLNIVKLLK